MEPKRLIELTVGIVVGLVVFSAILMPVVNNAKLTTGDEVTYTNTGAGYTLLTTSENMSISLYDTTITIDGVEYPAKTGTYWGIATDTWVIRYNGSTFDFTTGRLNGGEPYGPQIDGATITLADGNSTVEYTFDNHTRSETYSSSYTWAAIPSQSGEWITVSQNSQVYVNDLNDFILSGFYTTGDNDAYYTYYDGVSSAYYSSTTYPAEFTADLTLVEGTTDVYQTSRPLMHVGDESFTPYVYLVKEKISGHADSGTVYDMISVIPILIIAGLIIGIVGVAISRRE